MGYKKIILGLVIFSFLFTLKPLPVSAVMTFEEIQAKINIIAAEIAKLKVYFPADLNSSTMMMNMLTITSMSPSSVAAGGSSGTYRIYGANFSTDSRVHFDGQARTTTYVSPIELVVALSSTDIASAGEFGVKVTNGIQTSPVFPFTVSMAAGPTTLTPTPTPNPTPTPTPTQNNPAPTIASISPTSGNTGGQGFLLTVNGTNFVLSSVIKINTSTFATTYISSTQLRISSNWVPFSPGAYSITVVNPAPGGGTSNAATFTVISANAVQNNPSPTITSITPDSAVQGSPAVTVTINGTGFTTASTVNGGLPVTYISSTQLRTVIPVSVLNQDQSYKIAVANPAPGGGTSNSVRFTVTPAGTNPIPNQNPTPVPNNVPTPSNNTNGASNSGNNDSLAVGPGFTIRNVRDLQKVLNALGSPVSASGNGAPGEESGYYGINSQVALCKIQVANGLDASSEVCGKNFGPWTKDIFQRNYGIATALTTPISGPTIPISTRLSIPNIIMSVMTGVVPGQNPVPTITNLSSTATVVMQNVNASTPPYGLTVNGTGFIESSIVKFADVTMATQYVSDTQITATIPASFFTTHGYRAVRVFNPTPGGGLTTPSLFSVVPSTPGALTIISLSQTSVERPATDLTITITGTGFSQNMVAKFTSAIPNGPGLQNLPTLGTVTLNANSTTTATLAIPASSPFLASPGVKYIGLSASVTNGWINSNLAQFNITNPTPTVTAVTPTSAIPPRPGQIPPTIDITITGTGFVNGTGTNSNVGKSIVLYGLTNSSLATTFVDSTTLTAKIPIALQGTGCKPVKVGNIGPGGGVSAEDVKLRVYRIVNNAQAPANCQ